MKRAKSGPSTEEIMQLVEEREAARKEKDYETADRIRSELKAQGVDLNDVDREWRGADGRRGSFAAAVASRAVCDVPDETIVATVQEREAARQAHDYPRADELRESLRAQGVEILDKEKIWRTCDGRLGVLPGKLKDEEIAHLVQLRETERSSRNFEMADRIRQALRDVGVRLDDRMNTWSTDDGRGGSFGSKSGQFAIPNTAMMQQQQAIANPYAVSAYAVPPSSVIGSYSSAMSSPAQPTAHISAAATSAVPISELEILLLVHQHEESRALGDTVVQEAVRNVLVSRGVTLDERIWSWRAGDGRAGPMLFADASSYRMALSAAAGGSYQVPQTVGTLSVSGGENLEHLITLREQARAQRNFPVADRLRETLRARGVRLDDEQQEYVLPDGRQGKYPAGTPSAAAADSASSGTMSDAEIVALVAQREAARKQRDFATADSIRTKMRACGVNLDDKERVWSVSDGRRGNFDNE